jgi:hypothetical protein
MTLMKKSIRLETFKVTMDNLSVVRRMFVDMGKPRATIHKIDDAIVAIGHVIQSLEEKK